MARKKNPHAVALGRLGGTAAAGAGLKARYEAMTKQERSDLARRAAQKRWAKKKRRKE
jgi:hypothetical protein